MDRTTLLLVAVAAAAIVAISIVAAILLGRAAEEHDLASRVQSVLRPSADHGAAPETRTRPFAAAFVGLGEAVRRSALFSERDILDIERALAAAGQDPRRAGSTFLAIKVMLLLLLPAVGLAYAIFSGQRVMSGLMLTFGGAVLGIFLPTMVLGLMRRPFVRALQRGLPDALDLLVVCAEAGLGLESAIQRVAKELEASNRPTALEFATLGQELRILSDRGEAFMRLGSRTGLDGFRRLGTTLAQTLKYGTPLGQALRVLAVEMRQERMVRIEEKAAKLPALLVMPLILFIMPSLFIVLVGPSLIEMAEVMGRAK